MRGRCARLGLAARAVGVVALAVAPVTVGSARSDAAPHPTQVAPGVGDAADCDVVLLGGTCSLGPTADGSPYTWTIPPGLSRILAVVRGASGSTGDLFGAPGASGTVVAAFDVTPGSQLTMWVATAGDSRRGGDGWARGGDGGEAGDALLHDGAGGGGASAIADGSPDDPVVVGAGGGGGGATYNPTQVGGAGGAGSNGSDAGANGVGPPREIGTGGAGGCGGCLGPGAGGSGQTSTGFSPGGGGGAGWAAGGGGGAAVYVVSSGGGGGGGQNRSRGDAQQFYSGSGQVGQGLIQLMPAGTASSLGCADGVQTYDPPAGTGQVVVIAVGGQGSRGHNSARVGHPAVVEGLVDLEPGESLAAFVGCSGDTESRAGYGSGGNSGDAPGAANDGGGAGGGTAVWGGDGGTILVAGGGGGTGGDFDGTGGYGGDGGLGWGRNGAQAGQAGQSSTGNNGDGACGGCESHPNGGEGDNSDFPDFGGAGGGGGGGYWGGAGGQASFNAAGGGGGAGSSYAGGRLQNPGIGTAGVNHSQGNGAIVFVAIPAPQAGLRVTKVVTGAGSPAYSSGPFQLHSTCTHDGTTVLDVTDTVGPGASATHDGLPVGAACTVTEPGDGDATVPAPAQAIRLAAGINDVAMTNTFDVTSVVVEVQVAGASQYSQRDIVVHVACTFDGRSLPLPPPFAGGVLTFAPAGGSQTIAGLPQRAACSFAQAAGGSATTVEYEASDPPYARSTTPPRDLVLGSGTATFTVIDTWLLDTLTVSKAVAGNDPDPPIGQPFPMQVGCSFDGEPVTIAEPTFTVAVDASHVVPDLPIGAVCEIAETDSFDATSTTYSPASTVVVHSGGTTTVAVTNTFDVGSLAITKVVAGAGAEFANAEFVVSVSCVDGVTTTFEDAFTFPPTGGNVTVPAILTDSVCTVTEPVSGGATATTFQTASGVSVGSATVTIADGTTATVAITNRFDVAPLDVETRTLGDGVQFATADYVVDIACTFNELPVATTSFTFFPTGGSARIERLPVGARCAVDETQTGGADPVDVTTANADAPVVDGTTADVGIAPVAAGEPTSVRFDNTFDSATLTIVKVVTGPAAYAAGGFVIELGCTFDGRPVRQLGPDGTRTDQIVPTGGSVDALLPVGAACTVAELDDGGATTVDISAPTVTVAASGDTVTVTNTFLGGTLAVSKVVAGNDGVDHGPFPVDVACTFDGRTVDAPNGQAMSFALAAGAVDALTDLPVGARCVVVETDDDGATSTTFASSDPNVITTPTSASVTIDDATTTVTITNTFDVGPVTVAAALGGPGAPTYGAGRSFTVRIGCTRTIAGRTFPILLPADGRLVLDPANALTAAIPAVPAGANCAVVEDETHLATSVAIPVPGIVTAGAGLRLVIGLDWELGTVEVTKTVVGSAPDGVPAFPFAASCVAPTRRGPVAIPVAAGGPSFALAAGVSQSLTALAGASCTIVETDGAGATTSYAMVGGTAADVATGIGVVLGRGASGTVTVTNTFTAPAGPTTTASGSSGGRLPSTGSSITPVLVVAGVAIVVGVAVGQFGRRRGGGLDL